MNNEQYEPSGAGNPTPNSFNNSNSGSLTPITDDVVFSSGTKKKRKGLIATIIALVVLFIGGGIFAAFAILDSQPNNIAAKAFGNLMSADQVVVKGPIDISFQDSRMFGVSSVAINLDEEYINANNAASASISATLADGKEINLVDVGEVMMSDGVFYLKLDGLKTLYDDTLHDQIYTYILGWLSSSYKSSITSQCYDANLDGAAYETCISTYSSDPNPNSDIAIAAAADTIMTELGDIVSTIDGQWLEFSVDDILNSDMISSTMDNITRQGIASAYHCTTDKLSNLSQYSSELSDLYGKNPFLVLTAGQNSFYDITFDANYLAGYLNALPQTKLATDLASCTNASAGALTTTGITADSIAPSLEYLPQISAKFGGGLFNHYLSELKIDGSNEYYSVSADLNFTYSASTAISAPSDSRPVMDIVQQVYNQINSLQTSLYATQSQ